MSPDPHSGFGRAALGQGSELKRSELQGLEQIDRVVPAASDGPTTRRWEQSSAGASVWFPQLPALGSAELTGSRFHLQNAESPCVRVDPLQVQTFLSTHIKMELMVLLCVII